MIHQREVRGWRAWYTDDAVYTSRDVAPSELPEDGCLYVVAYLDGDSPHRHLYSGYDYYFWWHSERGLVVGGNCDPIETNRRRYPGATFVRGKWTTPDHMSAVRKRAEEAVAWP